MEVFEAAASLIVKSLVLSAQWAGQRRTLCLRQATAGVGEVAQLSAEVAALRDEKHRLEFENSMLRSRLDKAHARKPHYTPIQRLQILWHLAYYGIPRKRVKEHFGISISTLYRWLHAAERGDMSDSQRKRESCRKTPAEIARLIWDIFEANPHFGRHRIAMTMWALRIFVAASTVRNVLLRPAPPKAPATAAVKVATTTPRQIVARYPNHVWSVDRTAGMALACVAHLGAAGNRPLLADGDYDLPAGGAECRLGNDRARVRVCPLRHTQVHHHRPGVSVHKWRIR